MRPARSGGATWLGSLMPAINHRHGVSPCTSHRGIHPAAQHRVTIRTARLSDASRSPRRSVGRGGVIHLMLCPRNRERYSWSSGSSRNIVGRDIQLASVFPHLRAAQSVKPRKFAEVPYSPGSLLHFSGKSCHCLTSAPVSPSDGSPKRSVCPN